MSRNLLAVNLQHDLSFLIAYTAIVLVLGPLEYGMAVIAAFS